MSDARDEYYESHGRSEYLAAIHEDMTRIAVKEGLALKKLPPMTDPPTFQYDINLMMRKDMLTARLLTIDIDGEKRTHGRITYSAATTTWFMTNLLKHIRFY